jgi:hypothetical protein
MEGAGSPSVGGLQESIEAFLFRLYSGHSFAFSDYPPGLYKKTVRESLAFNSTGVWSTIYPAFKSE